MSGGGRCTGRNHREHSPSHACSADGRASGGRRHRFDRENSATPRRRQIRPPRGRRPHPRCSATRPPLTTRDARAGECRPGQSVTEWAPSIRLPADRAAARAAIDSIQPLVRVPVPRTPRFLHVAARVLACLSIVALDVILGARSWSIPATGLLDETAHLLTAWIVLNACARGRTRSWPWVLLGAVVIDVDHIPLFLWGVPVAAAGGRPVTHSLLTVLVLLAVAGVVLPARAVSTGLAAGVLLHLLRDIATGPGAPLLWPVYAGSLLVSHRLYLLLLGALAVIAIVSQLLPRRSPPHRRDRTAVFPRPVRTPGRVQVTSRTARKARVTRSPAGPH